MPLYDYQCGLGHRYEALRPAGHSGEVCSCGELARRVYGYTTHQHAPATDVRGMFRRFREASEEMGYAADKVERWKGEPVQTPNLWKAAKERAQQMIAAGEAPPVRKEW